LDFDREAAVKEHESAQLILADLCEFEAI